MSGQPEAPAIPGATRWRKKPSTVEAIQWNGANFADVKDFASGALGAGEVARGALPLWVVKSQALCHVQRDDWIIREPDGSGFYPCAAAVFAATYEPAADPLVMPADEERWTPEQVAEFKARFKATMAKYAPLRVLPSDRWKTRAEAAEARLAEVRQTVDSFLGHYGQTSLASFKVAQDLAEGIRQVLDREPLGTQERDGKEPS